MKVRIGIVGLPNVGKSTLFNALAQRASLAQAANFPFCTIDPNIAPIVVPSQYLKRLGSLAGSQKTVPATMEFVDVAGLVKGASRGEGLGNRFLATIRECSAICHVVRVHQDHNIIHVHGNSMYPVEDAEVVNLELLLADLSHVQRRLEKSTCVNEERNALEKVEQRLQEGIPARSAGLSNDETRAIKSMGLLTLKPVLYAFNVDEADYLLARNDAMNMAKDAFRNIQYCDLSQDKFTIVSAKLEESVSAMDTSEQVPYLESLGLEIHREKSSLDDLLSCKVLPSMIQQMLSRSLVYTGPGVPPERSRTTRAHLFQNNQFTVLDLAGRLHGDFVKGFVCAKVISAQALLQHSSYAAARDAGSLRTEGRDYVVNSDDVILIKWK